MRPATYIAAAALGFAAARCGGGDDKTVKRNVSVADVVSKPRRFDVVVLHGRGAPVGDQGFVLTGARAAVFVAAAPTEARKVDRGDTIQVRGRVRRLARYLANRIDRAAAGQTRRPAPVDRAALRRAPTDAGDPYIELIELRGEETISP